MRWESGRRSRNVEDRRGVSAGGPVAGGGAVLQLLPMLLRSKGGRWLVLAGVVLFFGARMLGIDLLPLISGGAAVQSSHTFTEQEQQLADFVAVVLADTEDTWDEIFAHMGRSYQHPSLVLFTGRVNSACGTASSAVGPFYCPADQKIYIDLDFYSDLKTRFQAPGDFAQAYVIAHEVGHHVQTLLGISQQVQQARRTASTVEGNRLSVMQELQADCFAGVWGYHADTQRQLLDPDDLDEALTAAAAIGDDRLQQQARGTVVPDSFTHGSSEQRVRWFKRGFDSGSFGACDTFSAASL